MNRYQQKPKLVENCNTEDEAIKILAVDTVCLYMIGKRHSGTGKISPYSHLFFYLCMPSDIF